MNFTFFDQISSLKKPEPSVSPEQVYQSSYGIKPKRKNAQNGQVLSPPRETLPSIPKKQSASVAFGGPKAQRQSHSPV